MSSGNKLSKFFFYGRLRWKQLLLLFAVIIGILSLFYTNNIVNKIRAQERQNVELWAKAILNFSSSNADCELNLTLDLLSNNYNIPAILTDSNFQVIDFVNIDSIKFTNTAATNKIVSKFKQGKEPIKLIYFNNNYNYLLYSDSKLLDTIIYFPYFQLAVICLFLYVSYFAFSNSRKFEQNFLWVGMAKETAHQLGTPISSLMAWYEYIKSNKNYSDDSELLDEFQKDIDRLIIITERFSKIGSTPILEYTNMEEAVQTALSYMMKRTPPSVHYEVENTANEEVFGYINEHLFNWVIENLVKNAIDAMEAHGVINIKIGKTKNYLFIDFQDSGKGIPSSQFKKIFDPGFTTKRRGWGLGLSLAKRIIDNYHQGKIYVKESELKYGTTFRINLPLENLSV